MYNDRVVVCEKCGFTLPKTMEYVGKIRCNQRTNRKGEMIKWLIEV